MTLKAFFYLTEICYVVILGAVQADVAEEFDDICCGSLVDAFSAPQDDHVVKHLKNRS